ncbi:uncharacterized protein F5891DRAFT_978398 [Suillus fuscotomentosus]|uniref:Uncharacterized protein n=1 Tax=Suillus fuscotomentosus TaxID=1912939 RepID=A0AAD4HNG4_9AGAM|nr:uncharacterized protein F5891DRAFT_978398 [Suillus fuscotomentosus]KAG1902952.1 hypothetical protein F5891DRAFT_978398 [Suillus fuscotomentosus]
MRVVWVRGVKKKLLLQVMHLLISGDTRLLGAKTGVVRHTHEGEMGNNQTKASLEVSIINRALNRMGNDLRDDAMLIWTIRMGAMYKKDANDACVAVCSSKMNYRSGKVAQYLKGKTYLDASTPVAFDEKINCWKLTYSADLSEMKSKVEKKLAGGQMTWVNFTNGAEARRTSDVTPSPGVTQTPTSY